MKLERKGANTSQSGVFKENEIHIRSENLDLALQDLITYSDSIGSIVREITSNCFDAHVEAGVDKPPVIRVQDVDLNNSQPYISFVDFGKGMDPNKIHNIYGSLYESDKRDSNEVIGAFGIGSKSPLSYSDTYFVITTTDVKDEDLEVEKRIKYSYVVSNQGNKFSITCISEEETDEETGTEIRLPIESRDIHRVEYKIKEQLKYFRQVDVEGLEIESNHQVEGDNFIVSSWHRADGYGAEGMHLCVGQVYYPLNREMIRGKVRREYLFDSPVALKMDIGEVEVTSKREAVKYTEQTIENIATRFEKAIEELDKISESQSYVETIDEAIDLAAYTNRSREKLQLSENISVRYKDHPGVRECKELPYIEIHNAIFRFVAVNVRRIRKLPSKPSSPTTSRVDSMDGEDMARDFFRDTQSRPYSTPRRIAYRVERDINSSVNWLLLHRLGVNDAGLIQLPEEVDPVEVYRDGIRKRNYDLDEMRLGIFANKKYERLAEKNGTNVKHMVAKRVASDLNKIINRIIERIKESAINYDTLEFTQSEQDLRKQLLANDREDKYVDRSEFPYKYMRGNIDEKHFRQGDCKVERLPKEMPHHVVYGFSNDRERLKDAYVVIELGKTSHRRSNADVLMVSKKNEKILKKYIPGATHVDKFFKDGIHRFFRRFMTKVRVWKSAVNEERLIMNFNNNPLGMLDAQFVKDLTIVSSVKREYQRYSSGYERSTGIHRIYDSYKDYYDKHNLWLVDVNKVYRILKGYYYKYPMLNLIRMGYGTPLYERNEVFRYIREVRNSEVNLELIYKLPKAKTYAEIGMAEG